MSVQPLTEENFCTNCGEWFPDSEYDYEAGWCVRCVSPPSTSVCSSCGGSIPQEYRRTICNACVQENWLTRHADEIEYMIVVKGYSYSRARLVLAELIRPICVFCANPIRYGTPGESLACSEHKNHGNRLRRMLNQGVAPSEAIKLLRNS